MYSLKQLSCHVSALPHQSPDRKANVHVFFYKFLAAGLIQHSIVIIIPEKSGAIRITVNYNKLNKLSILGQLAIPRVDEIRDKLGTGRIFSLFDLVSYFHQITVHEEKMPLTAFCTPPMRLFEWLAMSQGSSAAPGWFVKVINEVIKGLDRVASST